MATRPFDLFMRQALSGGGPRPGATPTPPDAAPGPGGPGAAPGKGSHQNQMMLIAHLMHYLAQDGTLSPQAQTFLQQAVAACMAAHGDKGLPPVPGVTGDLPPSGGPGAGPAAPAGPVGPRRY